ncbi:hypothetical protein [Rhodococcus sp. Chr-9]|uniref:hypothetical protein n=1 Tax=Rhodococcus sp. Chr-9 TaxID=713612 RepID=UPI0012698AA2|nr:hypothetical protein [Rhodococcus sp. Chr-9]
MVDLYVVQSKTASGAIGVQIWEKIRGRRQMIAHIGSAHTPGELAALIEIAKQRIDANQHELDLGLEDRASAVVRGEIVLSLPPDGSRASEVTVRYSSLGRSTIGKTNPANLSQG